MMMYNLTHFPIHACMGLHEQELHVIVNQQTKATNALIEIHLDSQKITWSKKGVCAQY